MGGGEIGRVERTGEVGDVGGPVLGGGFGLGFRLSVGLLCGCGHFLLLLGGDLRG